MPHLNTFFGVLSFQKFCTLRNTVDLLDFTLPGLFHGHCKLCPPSYWIQLQIERGDATIIYTCGQQSKSS